MRIQLMDKRGFIRGSCSSFTHGAGDSATGSIADRLLDKKDIAGCRVEAAPPSLSSSGSIAVRDLFEKTDAADFCAEGTSPSRSMAVRDFLENRDAADCCATGVVELPFAS